MHWSGLDAPRKARGATTTMLDLLFVLATVAFFAATMAFARWLDGLDAREAP
jgi:multisubunit Na+/H+ antiporter MnhF subunit